MTWSLIDRRAQGVAVLERFKTKEVSGELAASLESFRTVHGELEAAAQATLAACRARDAVLENLNAAVTVLDQQIDLLASRLVGAGLGRRRNPFAGLSRHTPSQFADLAWLRRVEAVRELARAIERKEPPEEVSRVLVECLGRAARIEEGVSSISSPQTAYRLQRGDRDAVVKRWSKAFAKLKLRSQLAWEDDPATFASLFAPPSLPRPIQRRGKGRAKQPERRR